MHLVKTIFDALVPVIRNNFCSNSNNSNNLLVTISTPAEFTESRLNNEVEIQFQPITLIKWHDEKNAMKQYSQMRAVGDCLASLREVVRNQTKLKLSV